MLKSLAEGSGAQKFCEGCRFRRIVNLSALVEAFNARFTVGPDEVAANVEECG